MDVNKYLEKIASQVSDYATHGLVSGPEVMYRRIHEDRGHKLSSKELADKEVALELGAAPRVFADQLAVSGAGITGLFHHLRKNEHKMHLIPSQRTFIQRHPFATVGALSFASGLAGINRKHEVLKDSVRDELASLNHEKSAANRYEQHLIDTAGVNSPISKPHVQHQIYKNESAHQIAHGNFDQAKKYSGLADTARSDIQAARSQLRALAPQSGLRYRLDAHVTAKQLAKLKMNPQFGPLVDPSVAEKARLIAQDQLAKGKGKITHTAGTVRDAATGVKKDVRRYIRKNPAAALMGAFGTVLGAEYLNDARKAFNDE